MLLHQEYTMSERPRPASNTHRAPELDTSFDPATFESFDTDTAEESHPFDNLETIRVDHNYLATAGTSQALTLLKVCKPRREWFFRTHPDSTYRLDTWLLVLEEDSETYYVDKPLWLALQGIENGFAAYRLRLAITRQGTLFVWPVRLPGDDGRRSSWAESAEAAATLAERQWIRVQADRQLSGYRVTTARLDDAPAWPEASFSELLKLAFRQKIIASYDHTILKRLRGEA
jgi:hypothetical protein